MLAPPPVTDSLREARRILTAASQAGLPLRAAGGVAVALISPSARTEPLRRAYQDIDFVSLSRCAHEIGALFGELGYEPEPEFNLLHGQRRLFFSQPGTGAEADVFLDRIEMCHALDLRDRLDAVADTLSPADLLLSKLQVVQTNLKDLKDVVALLADHPLGQGEPGAVDLGRVDELCTSNWPWWKTVTTVAGHARGYAAKIAAAAGGEGPAAVARERLDQLLEHLERAPKSRRWRLRARVGDRVRWYELPEDVEHEAPAARREGA